MKPWLQGGPVWLDENRETRRVKTEMNVQHRTSNIDGYQKKTEDTPRKDPLQNPNSTKWSLVLDGLTSYKDAHELQVALVQARRDGLDRDIFICLEHPPVFTLGRRGGLGGLKVPEDFLKSQGIDIVHVERGGDITYHGPGQIVLYPIMDLRFSGLSVVDYVTALEEVMIRTAADWSISAERNHLNRGVWVGQRKLGSVGIAVRRSVTFHGLALNVNTMLEHFGWIDPCGLQGISAASMAQIHGSPIDMREVRRSLLVHVEDVFGAALAPIGLEEVREMLNNEPQNRISNTEYRSEKP